MLKAGRKIKRKRKEKEPAGALYFSYSDTGDLAGGGVRDERRDREAALVLGVGAARMEGAAGGRIHRRRRIAGENKAVLDPFQPEKPEDVERLKDLQRDVHEDFKTLVRSRRNGKLKAEETELFSGAFWSGRQALALGLIDGIGHLRDIMRARFGEKTEFKVIAKPQGWGLRRLGFGTVVDPASGLIDAMEIRALWGRFGL